MANHKQNIEHIRMRMCLRFVFRITSDEFAFVISPGPYKGTRNILKFRVTCLRDHAILSDDKLFTKRAYLYSSPTGPNMFPIIPLGSATDWNFILWTRLWPLYTISWCWLGRQIGLTVPSMNPKQWSSGEPFADMAAVYSSRAFAFSNC